MQQRNRLINSILEENNKRMEIEGKVADLEGIFLVSFSFAFAFHTCYTVWVEWDVC